jgi:hypothetical protein
MNKEEEEAIHNSKNVLSGLNLGGSANVYRETKQDLIYDKLDKIYFQEKDREIIEKQKYKQVEQKVKINRVHQIESEYLLYKNKTQNEALFGQLQRTISRIWVGSPLNADRAKVAMSLLQYFEKSVGQEGLYLFLVGNVLLGYLGTNWMGLSTNQIRQGLLALSFNFLGQELDDNFLLNLVHLLLKSFLKYLFDEKIGADELKLVTKINESEKARDEEIKFQSQRIEKAISKEMKSRSRSKSPFLENNRKMNSSLQTFNVSSKSNKSQLFSISGKNMRVLKYRKTKEKIIKKLRVQCEESLRFQYFSHARQWKKQTHSQQFQSSIFSKLLKKKNFHFAVQDLLKNVNFSMFLIFKNVFILNILHYFYVKTTQEQKQKRVPHHHLYKHLKKQITSRVAGWPFEVNMNGLKTVKNVAASVIKNLIHGYHRPIQENKSVFSKIIDMVGKLIKDQKQMQIEINVDGKDIQDMLEVIRKSVSIGNEMIWPMVKAFPKDLALTDVFFNQIGLETQEPMPYFLHVGRVQNEGNLGGVLELEVFYRVDSRFSSCNNNEGNRFFLENIRKDLYGIKGKKCGRKGCQDNISRKVKVREFTLKEIRKRLKVASENYGNIPEGMQVLMLIKRFRKSGRNTIGVYCGLLFG